MDRDIRRSLAHKYNGMKQRCYNPKNDDGAIFHSVKEAAKSVGVHDTKVSAVCKGNRKTTGGHSFHFLTREEAEAALALKGVTNEDSGSL